MTEADLVSACLQNSEPIPKLSAAQIRTKSVVFGPRVKAGEAEQDSSLRILQGSYRWTFLGQRMTTLQLKIIIGPGQKNCGSPDYSRTEMKVKVNIGLYCLLCGILEPPACGIDLTTGGFSLRIGGKTGWCSPFVSIILWKIIEATEIEERRNWMKKGSDLN